MLSWSSSECKRPVELASIIDASVDPGPGGGRALVALARAGASMTEPDRAPLEGAAAEIGLPAAVDAAAVAGNFELMNRVVDATGLPIGQRRRESMRPVIDTLGLVRFPHASH